ncbi:MAG: hypothetical protein QM767_18935 [Anaeromyxobacter sp.]
MDRQHPDIFYVPENAEFHVREGLVAWQHEGQRRTLTLRATDTYVLPSGYRVHLEKQPRRHRLAAHRHPRRRRALPQAVHGLRRRQVGDLEVARLDHRARAHLREGLPRDMDVVEGSSSVTSPPSTRTAGDARATRPILSPERSLGSVIKLLTPSDEYTDEYNEWLEALPQTIRQLVFTREAATTSRSGATSWREHFTVDRVNGFPGHELKFDNHKLVANYLRVGFEPKSGSWRIYKLRPDFHPARQSPGGGRHHRLGDRAARARGPARPRVLPNPSVKLVANCEGLPVPASGRRRRTRGFDAQAEVDIASPGTFLSNFEPLTAGPRPRPWSTTWSSSTSTPPP